MSPLYKRLWGPVSELGSLYPHANPRGPYASPSLQSTDFIFVRIQGGFHEIRSAICDAVAVARLLNATLVIPEILSATSSKGISLDFKSFAYLYDEDQFVAALAKDVNIIVCSFLVRDMGIDWRMGAEWFETCLLDLIRELYETFRNFKIRIADYIRYRKITSNMNDCFPDATPEELDVSDVTCIICHEEMTTAKKLRCGHLFHVQCLRSWLERQNICPTCRALVVPPETGAATVSGQHGLQAGAPQSEMLAELCRREKVANIKPDPDIDLFMKVSKKLL